ncbi:MAG: hypothetical protein VX519_05800 [Myxococcota bacterium]|nr:hypothetical protein [Myxococcota bacterium]
MRTLILPLLALSPAALAAPGHLGHQGRLLDENGMPMEGTHALDFRLYDAAESGNILWEETHEVEVLNGYYSLVLGADEANNPIDTSLLSDNDLFLELTVDSGDALSPRQAFSAVPFARVAGLAENLSGGTVDASEVRVNGNLVVDGSGVWVGADPQLTEAEVDAYCANNGYAMESSLSSVATSGSYTDLSDTPALASVATSGSYTDLSDVPAQLTESEIDAYCADNGSALESSLAPVATSGSFNDLSDTPEAVANGVVGINASYYTSSDTFTVPSGISSLILYVTGGGGGGSDGSTTSITLADHSHSVAEHSHNAGSHTHSIGTHVHSGGSHSHSSPYSTCTGGTSSYGGCNQYTQGTTGAASGNTGESSGSTGAPEGSAATDGTAVTTDTAALSGGSVAQEGGEGGSGGAMSSVVSVSEGDTCNIVIGDGGLVDTSGTETSITCGLVSVVCSGGSAGSSTGTNGEDGDCTLTGGTVLSEYKATRLSPGGGGAGGNGSGATAGQSGSVAIRY